MKNKMKLVLGDWSDDGHGKTEEFILEVNKTLPEVQEAYKQSCKLTGISFNHNNDYTEVERDYKEAEKYRIVTKYEERGLTQECKDILTKYNINFVNYEECRELRYFVQLWIDFVKLSLQDLEVEIIEDKIPYINGYWGNLNVQFGYGLFY